MENEVRYLYLDDIIPNRFQPRENFDEQALKELAVSIKEHGVIQPIVVRQIGQKYEIIAGERRYKASTMAGLTKIPAIIRNLDDKESSKVALIENLQRRDLTPIEEARTYQKILELDALTQEDLARTMGKSQSAVSNKLRLLTLTDEVQEALLHEQISERHARSLLNVTDPKKQAELVNKVISSRMTVRELDQEIKNITSPSDNSSDLPASGGVNMDSNVPNVQPKQQEIENSNLNRLFPEFSNNPNKISNNLEHKMQESKLFNDSQKSDLEDTLLPGNNLNLSTYKDESKIDIIGGSGLLAGESPVSTNNNFNNLGLENNLYKNFEQRIPKLESSQNEIANNLVEPSVQHSSTTEVKSDNVSNIVGDIKTAVSNINSARNKVEIEEFDFDDFYQLVIRIDK